MYNWQQHKPEYSKSSVQAWAGTEADTAQLECLTITVGLQHDVRPHLNPLNLLKVQNTTHIISVLVPSQQFLNASQRGLVAGSPHLI